MHFNVTSALFVIQKTTSFRVASPLNPTVPQPPCVWSPKILKVKYATNSQQNLSFQAAIDLLYTSLFTACPHSVNVTSSAANGKSKAGDVLTCTSDGYPVPNYRWTDSNDVEVSTGAAITLSGKDSSLTCTATSNFTPPCSVSKTFNDLGMWNMLQRYTVARHIACRIFRVGQGNYGEGQDTNLGTFS